MTTAKPQPMAGQSDAPDDLIAELAKLMAQDAKGDQPAAPQAPMFSVRIPGGESAPESAPAKPVVPPPAPRLDFTPTASPAAPSSPIPAAPRQEPVLAAPTEEPAPFHFDFDLNSNRRPNAQPAMTPQPAPDRVAPQTFAPAPAPSPMASPRQAAPAAPIVAAPVIAAPVVPAPVAPEPVPVDDHDSIADLIAAELAGGDADDTPGDEPDDVDMSFSDQRDAEPLYVEPTFERPTEQDRFSVPPVFGLGTRTEPARVSVEPPFTRPVVPTQAARPSVEPSFTRPVLPTQAAPPPRDTAPVETYPIFASAPTVAPEPEPVPAALSAGADVGLDPIDEIESLIGRAVRVELDLPTEEPPVEAPERPLASAALRSLATPTLPPEAPVPPQRRRMSGVDETIFAAAEASGAQVGWVGSPELDRDDTIADAPIRERKARSFRMSRAVMGPIVALGLLLVAGLGLYWVLGMERDTGPAPLLTADSAPVKEVPKVDPAAEASQSVIFNEMDGVVPGAEEQLVSRDQADVNEVTQAPTAAVSEEGLANRKVRTLTVRPDGTIVSGDDSVAGSTILPVDRPNVPAVPGAETASPELLASTTPAPTPTPAVVAPTVTPTPVVNETPVTPGATVPAVDMAGNPIAGKTTTIPRKRPSSFAPQAAVAPAAAAPTSVNAIINNAAATPEATSPLAQATEVAALGNTAPAYVQLASQRSEAEARQTAGTLVSRFGPIFKGASLEVQRVDLGAKGVFYRVRVPASSLQDANNLCADVKAAGGDCFAM